MNIVPHYNSSRNSSIPLEHKFGFARAKSRNVHTLTRFLNVISETQSVGCEETTEMLKRFNAEEEKIRGRINHDGVTFEMKSEDTYLYTVNEEDFEDLPFPPQKVAKAFLFFAGFEVDNDEKCYELIITFMENFLSEFVGDEPEKRKQRRMLSPNALQQGTSQCIGARQRIIGLPYGLPNKNRKESKMEYRKRILSELCKAHNIGTSRRELLKLVYKIKQKCKCCPDPPSDNSSKKFIYDWLIKNLNHYYASLLV